MINFKLFFIFIITLFYIKYSASLQYLPPDREIEVTQRASYRIGVEDVVDLDITRCNFTSDTGLNCSFEVWPTRANDNPHPIYCNYNGELYLFENTVTDHGREGLCQITVDMVEHTGPSTWTLIAEDFEEQVVIKNTFKIHFFYKATLLEYEIRALEFSSFVNHMTGFAYDELVSCNVKFNETKIELDLHSTRTSTNLAPYSKETEEVLERVSSLGIGLCGFKYTNATYNIEHLTWTFTATDNNGNNYRQNFVTSINARPIPENMHFRRVAHWGTEVRVPCGSSPLDSYSCSIFNPRGELVSTRECKYDITSFSMNDVGVWKCYAGSKFTMESLEYTIELVGKDAETVEIWNYETDSYLSMGCKTAGISNTHTYCKMVAPNQHIFMLQPGVATDRYLSLGTNVHEGVCSLQIKKPLQEIEKGTWLCEIGVSYRNTTGSPIVVGEAQTVDYPKYLKVTTQLNQLLTINCAVPYFTEYCRIRAPNGATYNSVDDEEVRLGRCFTTITVSASDNGTWVCLFGRKTGEPDDEIVVEVIVAEVLQYYKFVEVDSDDSAELICSSGGLPLKYCRFISPSGKGYQIQQYHNSSTISYFGRGLHYGDCGIKIMKTKMTDNGYWTCVTQIIPSTKNSEISARMLVQVNEIGPNLAAIGIGMGVSVILVGSIVGMVVIRKWRRRAHDEFPGTTTAERGVNTDDTLSQHSQSSESNIFSMETIPPSYNRDEGTAEHPL